MKRDVIVKTLAWLVNLPTPKLNNIIFNPRNYCERDTPNGQTVCMMGAALMLSGLSFDEVDNISAYGAEIAERLDIPYEDAHHLAGLSLSGTDLKSITKTQAANVLWHYLNTGEVDWAIRNVLTLRTLINKISEVMQTEAPKAHVIADKRFQLLTDHDSRDRAKYEKAAKIADISLVFDKLYNPRTGQAEAHGITVHALINDTAKLAEFWRVLDILRE